MELLRKKMSKRTTEAQDLTNKAAIGYYQKSLRDATTSSVELNQLHAEFIDCKELINKNFSWLRKLLIDQHVEMLKALKTATGDQSNAIKAMNRSFHVRSVTLLQDH